MTPTHPDSPRAEETLVERLAEKSEKRNRSLHRRMVLGRLEARWWLNAIADDPKCPLYFKVWLRSQAQESDDD